MNDRQRRFADGILQGKTQRQAYIAAGYKSRGAAADARASQLLRNAKVAAYLEEQREKVEERTLLSAEWVVDELANQAFFTFDEIWGAVEGGIDGPEDIKRLPERVQRLIKGYKFDRHGNFILELVDRQRALDRLGKVFGIYQGDRLNDRDRQAQLATQVLWRFIMAMHISRGVPFADAWSYAENNPDEVQEWGREVGLVTSGDNEP